MSKTSCFVVALIIFVLSGTCLNVPLSAQTVDGTILGLVQDPQGSAIPKAAVSARNVETGVVRETTADDNGSYRISSVPAGPYEISSTADGFKTELRRGVIVTVGADVSVNFSLTVGSVSEKLEVTEEAQLVDTASSAMGGFVNSATIRELPLNGRDWLQLALLQPGVNFNTGQQATDAGRSSRGNGVAMTISGGRPTDNVFRIDGLVVNDATNGGPGSSLRVNMGVDAIREFSVLSNNYSAEYGRGSGGVVNAITKSGTNEFHGSAYEFVRNSAFDARNFYDPKDIAPFHRNQYGGAVGGPIKKDKLFFFTNYEKLGELKSLSASFTTPSANAHNGILCANPACTSTNQFAISPKIVPFLNLFPYPNGSVTGDTGIFAYAQARRGEENYVFGKIDYYFSPTTTLAGSYSFDNTQVSTPDDYNLKLDDYPTRRQNVVLSLQHLFSPNVVNVTRAGVSRSYSGGGTDSNPRSPLLSDLSLGSLPGQNIGAIVLPGVSGQYSGIGNGSAEDGFQSFAYTAPQLYDDLSWTKGRHNLRMGFSFERIQYNENSASRPNGVWTFTTLQNFFQGVASQFQGAFPGTDAIRGARMSVIGGYIQDDFRVLPNLTINLGVRYEMGTVITEVNNKLANLRRLTDPQTTVGNPYYQNPTLKNFAPRIGFSWDPFKDGKTAVRAGFGMFDLVPLPYVFQARIPRAPPFYRQGNLSNPPASAFPNQIFQLLVPATASTAYVQFDPPRSYRAQWNFNVQRQLTHGLALTAGYVGSSGVHLAHAYQDANQVPPSPLVRFDTAIDAYVFPIPAPGTKPQRINPNFGSIQGTDWSGHSSYHALQVNVVQRPIKGFYYQIAYSWSKSIDNGSNTFNEGGESTNSATAPWAFDPRLNRGVSDYNVPQSFVANFQYELPTPARVKAHAFTNVLLGGWQIGGIYTRQSGAPFSLRLGSDRAGTGSSSEGGSNGGQRPMYVNAPGCSPDAITGDIDHYINTQCIAFPAQGVLGNLGRNTLHMPVFRNLDFSMFKNQNLWGERLKAQFRVEVFNILNNTNLQANSLATFNGSGQLLSGLQILPGPTANSSRQIQLGLRLIF